MYWEKCKFIHLLNFKVREQTIKLNTLQYILCSQNDSINNFLRKMHSIMISISKIYPNEYFSPNYHNDYSIQWNVNHWIREHSSIRLQKNCLVSGNKIAKTLSVSIHVSKVSKFFVLVALRCLKIVPVNFIVLNQKWNIIKRESSSYGSLCASKQNTLNIPVIQSSRRKAIELFGLSMVLFA